MSDRDNVRLAIGYGLGAGLVLAGLLVLLNWLAGWLVGFELSGVIVGAVIVIGGVAIAVLNAFKMDRETVSAIEDPDE